MSAVHGDVSFSGEIMQDCVTAKQARNIQRVLDIVLC